MLFPKMVPLAPRAFKACTAAAMKPELALPPTHTHPRTPRVLQLADSTDTSAVRESGIYCVVPHHGEGATRARKI